MYPATGLKRLRKLLDSISASYLSDGWVAISDMVADHYQIHLGIQRPTVIPNSFPLSGFPADNGRVRKEVLSRYSLAEQDFVVVCAARLVVQKGYPQVISAVEILFRAGTAPKVLIAGGGPLKESLQHEISARRLQDHLLLIGEIPRAQVLRLMIAADVVMSASTVEGFHNTPAEAMALGKPVIATTVGAMPEVIENGKSGLLVRPGDPEVLAEALSRLMADPALRQSLGRAARARIAKYSTDEVVCRWEQYYGQLLATPAAS